jgi:hypothetical protein
MKPKRILAIKALSQQTECLVFISPLFVILFFEMIRKIYFLCALSAVAVCHAELRKFLKKKKCLFE